MRYTITTILVLLATLLFSQIERCHQDSSYVWAKSGLTLRAMPEQASEKLGVIEYGTQVLLLDQCDCHSTKFKILPAMPCSGNTQSLELSTIWEYIEVGSQRGWVAGLYLSRMKPPATFEFNGLGKYLTNNFDTIYSERVYDSHTYGGGTVYSTGVTSVQNYHEGGGNTVFIVTGNLCMTDGFILINLFTSIFDGESLEDYECINIRRTDPDEIDVTINMKEGNGQYFTISTRHNILVIKLGGFC